MQVSRLWKDQVGGLKGLWLAQARRIGCQTSKGNQKPALSRIQEEKGDWASVPDELSVVSRDITSSRASELRDSSPGEAFELIKNWKRECVAGLKLKHLLDAGKAWTHEELVNLVKAPGRCLSIVLLFQIRNIFLPGLQHCTITRVTLPVERQTAALRTLLRVPWCGTWREAEWLPPSQWRPVCLAFG